MLYSMITASEKSLRKHVLCLKKENSQTAATGVVNIVAMQLSKKEKIQGNMYTISYVGISFYY